MKISVKIILWIFAIFFLSNCGEYEQLERKKLLVIQADSTFATQRDSMRKHYDSICDIKHQDYYNESLDSIKAKQIEEIRDLIGN